MKASSESGLCPTRIVRSAVGIMSRVGLPGSWKRLGVSWVERPVTRNEDGRSLPGIGHPRSDRQRPAGASLGLGWALALRRGLALRGGRCGGLRLVGGPALGRWAEHLVGVERVDRVVLLGSLEELLERVILGL